MFLTDALHYCIESNIWQVKSTLSEQADGNIFCQIPFLIGYKTAPGSISYNVEWIFSGQQVQ